MKWKLLLFVLLMIIGTLLFILMSMIPVQAQVTYDDCSIYGTCKPVTSINYSLANVNNSQYLQSWTWTSNPYYPYWYNQSSPYDLYNYNMTVYGIYNYNQSSPYDLFNYNMTIAGSSFYNATYEWINITYNKWWYNQTIGSQDFCYENFYNKTSNINTGYYNISTYVLNVTNKLYTNITYIGSACLYWNGSALIGENPCNQ